MNDRKRPLLLAALPIAWLLLGAPVSVHDERDVLHYDQNAEHRVGHD